MALIAEKYDAENACSVRIVEADGLDSALTEHPARARPPFWPRKLTAGLHAFIVAAAIAMVGLLGIHLPITQAPQVSTGEVSICPGQPTSICVPHITF